MSKRKNKSKPRNAVPEANAARGSGAIPAVPAGSTPDSGAIAADSNPITTDSGPIAADASGPLAADSSGPIAADSPPAPKPTDVASKFEQALDDGWDPLTASVEASLDKLDPKTETAKTSDTSSHRDNTDLSQAGAAADETSSSSKSDDAKTATVSLSTSSFPSDGSKTVDEPKVHVSDATTDAAKTDAAKTDAAKADAAKTDAAETKDAKAAKAASNGAMPSTTATATNASANSDATSAGQGGATNGSTSDSTNAATNGALDHTKTQPIAVAPPPAKAGGKPPPPPPAKSPSSPGSSSTSELKRTQLGPPPIPAPTYVPKHVPYVEPKPPAIEPPSDDAVYEAQKWIGALTGLPVPERPRPAAPTAEKASTTAIEPANTERAAMSERTDSVERATDRSPARDTKQPPDRVPEGVIENVEGPIEAKRIPELSQLVEKAAQKEAAAEKPKDGERPMKRTSEPAPEKADSERTSKTAAAVPEPIAKGATSKWYEAGEAASADRSAAMSASQPTKKSGTGGVIIAVAGIAVAVIAVLWSQRQVRERDDQIAKLRQRVAELETRPSSDQLVAGNDQPDVAANPTDPSAPDPTTTNPTTTNPTTTNPTTTNPTTNPPTTNPTTNPTTTNPTTTSSTTANAGSAKPMAGSAARPTNPPAGSAASGTKPLVVGKPTTGSATPAAGSATPNVPKVEIDLIVMSTPPGAMITTSTGRTLGKTPLITKVTKGEELTLFFELEGMAPAQRRLRPSGETTINMKLTPQAKPAPQPDPTPPAPPPTPAPAPAPQP